MSKVIDKSIDATMIDIQDDIDTFSLYHESIEPDAEADDTEESVDAYDDLEQAIAGTEFEETGDGFTDLQEISLPGARSKARRLIGTVVGLVRRNRRYAGCAPRVARAVRAFARKRYVTAFRHALSAYRCIQSKR